VDGFDATPVELQICGAMLADLSGEIHDKLSVLRGEMDALLDGGWQGAAANGFARGWERWQAGANEVLAALRTMGRLLGTTGQDYAALDGASSDQLLRSGEGL